VIDRERILTKLDELDGYLAELRSFAPDRFEEYRRTEKKRACERLLQLLVETSIDTCALLVAGLRLGLPGDEDDLLTPRWGTESRRRWRLYASCCSRGPFQFKFTF